MRFPSQYVSPSTIGFAQFISQNALQVIKPLVAATAIALASVPSIHHDRLVSSALTRTLCLFNSSRAYGRGRSTFNGVVGNLFL